MKIQAQSKRHISPIPIFGPTRREKLKGNHKLIEPTPRFSSKLFGIGALTLKSNNQSLIIFFLILLVKTTTRFSSSLSFFLAVKKSPDKESCLILQPSSHSHETRKLCMAEALIQNPNNLLLGVNRGIDSQQNQTFLPIFDFCPFLWRRRPLLPNSKTPTSARSHNPLISTQRLP